MTLGSIENARIIATARADRWARNRALPKGWKKIGQGGTRTAYLGPDGVVYKVQHDWDFDECNRDEVKAARRLKKNVFLQRQGVHIPETVGYRVKGKTIVAMEYIAGKPSRCNKASWDEKAKCSCRTFGTPRICFGVLYDMLDERGFNDCYSGNVLYTPDNKIWLIDLGYE